MESWCIHHSWRWNSPLIRVEFASCMQTRRRPKNVMRPTTLTQEAFEQRLVYFITKVLHYAETWYQQIEKVVLRLLTTKRQLRPYFQSHQVVIRTHHPIAKILRKFDLARRMIWWSIELSEFDIQYESRCFVKGQILTDFAV